MEIKLEHFVHDLVWLIKKDYNDSLHRMRTSNVEAERLFAEAQHLAYFDVLQLIENQLQAFGAREEFYKGVAPEPGQEAEFKKASF